MNEFFLHFIWQNKLFENNFTTDSGELIEILSVGERNFDSGPDFLNAKIKIAETLWSGNVEIHCNSSDWLKHKHNTDRAYDNVILQVVKHKDTEIYRTSGTLIQTVELKFDNSLYDNYLELAKPQNSIACREKLKTINSFVLEFWLQKMLVEKLENKATNVIDCLNINQNNWSECFYRFLARNFGFKLNSLPFEMLAKSLPLNYLAKHKDNLLQVEAMLFGQAGFLEKEPDNADEYYLRLRNEYLFLKKKFNLQPIDNHLWKFLRLRPPNFPTIRIAQFAALIHLSSSLFSKVIEIENVTDCYKLFDISASKYWETHYNFNKISTKKRKTLGKSSIQTLLINTVVPFIFIYGKYKGAENLQDRALSFLEQIEPEENSIVAKWEEVGITIDSAFKTQALIHLHDNYCTEKKCLNCEIGNKFIMNK